MKKIEKEVWDYVGDPETLKIIKQALYQKGIIFNQEDIIQEVVISLYLKFINRPDKYITTQDNKSLLRKMAGDCIIDYLRANKYYQFEVPSSFEEVVEL